jgi:hypothetical protein
MRSDWSPIEWLPIVPIQSLSTMKTFKLNINNPNLHLLTPCVLPTISPTALSIMLPPSDSFRHQLQKLAEVRANRNNSSLTAPPPYTPSVCRPDVRDVMAIDPDQEEESGPIIIRIDNSVSVSGQDNAVIIPTGATITPDQTELSTSPANRPNPRYGNLSSTVTTT